MLEHYDGDAQELTEFLKNAPLLCKFLDPDTFPDINDYLADLDETSSRYLDQLSRRILDFDNAVINPLVFNSIAWGLGINTSEDERISFNRSRFLTRALVAIGFEFPDTGDIDKFSYYIIHALTFRNQLYSATEDGRPVRIQRLAAQGPIFAGVYFRDHYLPDLKNPDNSSTEPSPTPIDANVYGEFLGKLFDDE